MFVREQIQEGVHHGMILAPQQAISHDQKGDPNALVVGANDIVELRALQIGRAVGDQWIVSMGLKAGDRLIVEGLQFAHPGSKVAAEEYRPRPSQSARVQSSPPSRIASTQPGTE
jgi:membrane fusion protein (multidrug efflux system)